MHVRHCKVLSGPEGVGYKEEVSMEANLTALTKIAVVFLGVAFAQGAVAQETSDIEKVKAASQAFYAALNARNRVPWQRCGLIPHMSYTSAP
jgi:hypothetical protein